MVRFLIACMIALPLTIRGQDLKWEWLNPDTNGNLINDISLIHDGKTIVACYDSLLLLSNDQGVVWSQYPVSYQAYRIFTPSSTLSLMTTMDGAIIKNVIGGIPKKVFQKSALNARFKDIQIDSVTGIGLAVGDYEVDVPSGPNTIATYYWALVIRTIDFGETWNVVYEAVGDRLGGLSHHKHGYIVYGTETPNYAIESFDGITWSRNLNFGSAGTDVITGVAFVNDSVGVVSYAYQATLYFTENAGQTWQPRTELRYLTSLATNKSSLAGIFMDSIYVSSDAGKSWTAKKAISIRGLNSFNLVLKGNVAVVLSLINGIFVASADDFIFKSVNTNLNYYLGLYNGFVLSSNVRCFTSSTVGYNQVNGALFKTTDGGCHWSRLSNFFDLSNYSYQTFHFFNDTTVLALNGSIVQKTTDGGQTWKNVGPVPGYSGPGPLVVFSPLIMTMIDNNNDYYRTIDGGETWAQTQNAGSLAALPPNGSPFVLGSSMAIATYFGDHIRVSIDAGMNWTTYTTGFGLNWTAAHFFDPQNGLMVGWDYVAGPSTASVLIKTNNGGATWSKVRDLPQPATGIKFIDATTGFLWGHSGMIFKTTDAGQSWQPFKTILTNDIQDIFVFGDLIFVLGYYNAIIKSTGSTPIAEFQLPNHIVCAGDSITTHNTSQFALSYVWSVDGKVTSFSKEPKLKIDSPGFHQVSLTSGTCKLTFHSSVIDSIKVNPIPSKPVLSVNGKVSHGSLKLCDSTYLVTTQPIQQYFWSNGATSSTVTINKETSLSLKVENQFNCAAYSDTLKLIRVPLPVADFTIAYVQDRVINFHSTSTDADTFFWKLSDLGTSTLADWQHSFDTSIGDFDATLIAGNYCGVDTLKQHFVILGIQPHEVLSVYPNPASTGVIKVIGDDIRQYSITSVLGQVVTEPRPLVDGVVPVSALVPGVYTINLVSDDGRQLVVKVVIN